MLFLFERRLGTLRMLVFEWYYTAFGHLARTSPSDTLHAPRLQAPCTHLVFTQNLLYFPYIR